MDYFGYKQKKYVVKRVMGELEVLNQQNLNVLLSTHFDTYDEIVNKIQEIDVNGKTTIGDLFISPALPRNGEYFGGYYIVDHVVKDNGMHIVYIGSDGVETTTKYEDFFAKANECLHPNRYYNKLFRTLAFWVCPDCKKEL